MAKMKITLTKSSISFNQSRFTQSLYLRLEDKLKVATRYSVVMLHIIKL